MVISECYKQVYNIGSKVHGQDHVQIKGTLEALNAAKQKQKHLGID